VAWLGKEEEGKRTRGDSRKRTEGYKRGKGSGREEEAARRESRDVKPSYVIFDIRAL